MQEKIFKDPIYGNISVPKQYCEAFIDTEIFQRLRRIEQTSMRVVYPSAHHDRFSHSLGVFYLGREVMKSVRLHSEETFIAEISILEWEKIQKTFEIACLLHDCTHAPFSHTFEQYFLLPDSKKEFISQKIKSACSSDTEFALDFKIEKPQPHEIYSAIMAVEYFGKAILNFGADPTLVARMITGCHYKQGRLSLKKKVLNRVISLLNGNAFDVDSLDYIQRDTWASGVNNVSIDYNRLVKSVYIGFTSKEANEGNPSIIFHKQALSVIENVSIGRNFLYKWIYTHHKVVYEQYLLEKSINYIDQEIAGFSEKVLSYDVFNSPQEIKNSTFFLTSDDDLFHIFKKYFNECKEIRELLSRQYKFHAVWKTRHEYKKLLNFNNDDFLAVLGKISDTHEILGEKVIVCEANPKIKGFESTYIQINLGGTFIDITDVTGKSVAEDMKFFYLYVPDSLTSKKEMIVEECRSLMN